MTNFVFIGDVHSQFSKFSKAVDWIDKNVPDYHIIQGGDLFDSRTEESDSLNVYNLIKEMKDRITVLHSNHHWKLYRILSDPTVTYNHIIERTVNELSSVDNEDIINWLNSLPYGICIKDHNNVEYRVCHAYWPSKLYVPHQYDFMHKIHTVSSKSKGLMIYGIGKKVDGQRVEWWKDKKDDEFVRVAFHYHEVSMDLYGKNGCKHLILDGSCGDDDGRLIVYDVNSKVYKEF